MERKGKVLNDIMYFLLHNCPLSFSHSSPKYWYEASFINRTEKIVLFNIPTTQEGTPWYFELSSSVEKTPNMFSGEITVF